MLEIEVTDPSGYTGSRGMHWFDRRLESLVREVSDVALIRVPILTAAMLWPCVTFFVVAESYSWWLVPGYVLLSLMLAGSYGSFMHEMAHSKFLKERWRFLYPCIEWGVTPLFGSAPNLYRALHIGMHHVENNGRDDYHSTLAVQRDSLASHLRLWVRIVLLTDVAVLRYSWRKRRKSFLRSAAWGVAAYWGAVGACLIWNYQVALTVFILPMLVIRFAAALNNSCEHLFIDPEDPSNLYRNSSMCINNPYNRAYFNGLYHATHHLRPSAAWTGLPQRFVARIAEYRREDAIVFQGITHVDVFFLLVRKRYADLARHYVQDPAALRSESDVINLLKYRAGRILVETPRRSASTRSRGVNLEGATDGRHASR